MTRLKWFNGPKGFGFVVPEDRPDVDAFLHITTLQRAGIRVLGDGACLLCYIQYGSKGALVSEVLELAEPGTAPRSIPSGGMAGPDASVSAQKMDGTVKWYNSEKEFGFVVPDDGGKDVFVHKTCLQRNRLKLLEPGQRVRMTFRSVPKGREVVEISVIS